jgi:FkbM family methyltransferase
MHGTTLKCCDRRADARHVHQAPVIEDLVFDVGLHRGEDSDYYLRKGYRVVAFEANPTLVKRARDRFAAELASGTMTIIEGAIDDHGRESIKFFIHPQMSVWGTTDEAWALRNAPRGGRSTAVEVPTVNFRQAIERFGVPHYMKVDIEGADRICLESLRHFRHRPRYVSIESEKTDWQALEAEFDLLERLGYGRFAICQQADIHHQALITQTRTGDSLRYQFEEGASGPFGDDLDEPWTDRTAALRTYATLFRRYRIFGDASPLASTRPGRVARRVLSDVLHRPLPGWYDTHARI